MRIDALSKEYVLELLNLLDNLKPFPYRQVQTIFLQELGAAPEKLFKDFQKEPFAAASFGQVHAAKLDDNTIVAVKVMRPGIEEDVLVDFIFVDLLAFFADIFFNIKALPWKEFAQEFKRWTKQEIDYQIEAENAEKLYKGISKDSLLVLPKTYHHFSTRKILIQEYIEGIPLSRVLRGLKDGRLDAKKLLQMGIDIKKTPRTLVFEIFKQYFLLGFFHADPHPGNILLLQNDRIGLVDFGIMGEAITHNKTSFVNWVNSTANMDFEKATYHFANFSAGNIKRVIASALPANVDQEKIDEFMDILARHFSKTVNAIVSENRKELELMNTDYTIVFFKILKASESFNVKLPKEATIFIRALSIIGFLAKEMDYEFKLVDETRKFLKHHPLDTLIKDDIPQPFKRINHERALEELNNWLTFLVEKDPALYHLVNNYIGRYNVVDR